jgi:hypothetical protein
MVCKNATTGDPAAWLVISVVEICSSLSLNIV